MDFSPLFADNDIFGGVLGGALRGALIGGVVSMYGKVAVRPSVAFAFTHS